MMISFFQMFRVLLLVLVGELCLHQKKRKRRDNNKKKLIPLFVPLFIFFLTCVAQQERLSFHLETTGSGVELTELAGI